MGNVGMNQDLLTGKGAYSNSSLDIGLSLEPGFCVVSRD